MDVRLKHPVPALQEYPPGHGSWHAALVAPGYPHRPGLHMSRVDALVAVQYPASVSKHAEELVAPHVGLYCPAEHAGMVGRPVPSGQKKPGGHNPEHVAVFAPTSPTYPAGQFWHSASAFAAESCGWYFPAAHCWHWPMS